MHDLTQKTRKKDIIFEGQILRVRKDEAEMPDGQIVEREVVEHPGGVGIALENEDGKYKRIVDFYVSDDQNHVPVRLDMFLRFGSAKAFLVSMKGLRHPVTSAVSK